MRGLVLPGGSSPTVMAFPFSKLPGYPEEANTTETAQPGRNVSATASNRCSTQAFKGREG